MDPLLIPFAIVILAAILQAVVNNLTHGHSGAIVTFGSFASLDMMGIMLFVSAGKAPTSDTIYEPVSQWASSHCAGKRGVRSIQNVGDLEYEAHWVAICNNGDTVDSAVTPRWQALISTEPIDS